MPEGYKLDFGPTTNEPQQQQMNPNPEGGMVPESLFMGQAQNTDGIQLDEIGMAESFYDGLAGLRAYALDMSSKGIDVTKGYDFRNPLAAKANAIFQQGVAQMNYLAERLTQGARNLRKVRDDEAAGNLIVSDPSIYQGGPLTAQRMQEGTFSTNLQDIQVYNQTLSGPVTSEDDYKAKLAYRDQAIQEIIGRGNFAGKPDEYRAYLENHLAMPSAYNPTDDNFKKAQTSRQWQAYNSQKADESYIDPRLAGVVDLFSEWKNAEFVPGDPSTAPAIGAPKGSYATFNPPALMGSGYKGGTDFNLTEIRATETGKFTAVFNASPGVEYSTQEEMEAAIESLPGKKSVSRSSWTDGSIEVDFTENNVADLLASVMSEAQFDDAMKNANRRGVIRNGRMSIQGLEQIIEPGPRATKPKEDKNKGSKSAIPVKKLGFSGSSPTPVKPKPFGFK